jgi:hypothetical protein
MDKEIVDLISGINLNSQEKKQTFHETHTPITVWVPNETELKYREAQKKTGQASKVLKEIVCKVVEKL